MIVIRTLDGREVDANEKAIVLITGQYPHDIGPRTYVHGVTAAALPTAERAEALVARLAVEPPLARLTRPDLTPVWVKGEAVTSARLPLPIERQGPGAVNAVIEIGSHHQSLHEDLQTARGVINAHGGNI